MNQYEIFSRNLSKLVERRGINQSEIASRIGVSNAAVSGWMNGTKVPRMDKLNALCNLLGVGTNVLTDENGFEEYDAMDGAELINLKKLNMKKVPLVGSVAAGEPINDAEFPDAFVLSPAECDFAIRVHGDSMEPSYMEGDIVYVKSVPVLPYDGAVVVLRIGHGECAEHCIKHAIQTNAGVVIMSDNPAYPAKLITPDQAPTIIGVPVGFTRMYKKS